MPTNTGNSYSDNRRAAARPGSVRGTGQRSAPAGESGAGSNLMGLASRIREEQGMEGLREFITAMEPFAAPNELRALAKHFSLDYSALRRNREQPKREPQRPEAVPSGQSAGAPFQNAQQGFPQGFGDPRMMQLMNMMKLMNGAGAKGGDQPMMQLMTMLPLLQSMMH